ncbi:MAG: peptide chain release factor aRF-1 [Candidatus Aenigmatarchaeota archaeon]
MANASGEGTQPGAQKPMMTKAEAAEVRVGDEKKKYKLKKLIDELSAIRGRHTELVSVYIPAGYSITDVIGQLKDEQGTSTNIKSKTTRKNVTTALEKIIQYLKRFKQTPENGLGIFAGNVSETEGKEDIRVFSTADSIDELPEPIKTKLYWCDQTFVLEPLKTMVQEHDIYALIVLDARDASIGLLSGKSIKTLKNLDSTVPSKTVKGGMSQGRYDRIREDAIHEFLTEIGDVASELLLKHELKGLIIGGPGPVKEKFAKGKYLNYMVMNKLLGVKDTGYTGEFGLRELVERAEDLLKDSVIAREKAIMNRFFTELEKNGLVTYGMNEVKQSIEAGAVETLLMSEAFDWVRVRFGCQCGNEETKDLKRSAFKAKKEQKCGKCDGWMKPSGEELDLMDVIMEAAEKTGAKVEMISTETPEGGQFKELGGIGAILRYKAG